MFNLKLCYVMTLSEVIISFSVLAKFNLPAFAPLILRDSAGVEVDSDLFDELLKSSQILSRPSPKKAVVKKILLTLYNL